MGWQLYLRANRLDIVAVRIDQKRRIISRAVILPCPGAAIVAAAGLQALGMEFRDRGMVRRAERDMRTGARALVQMQPERGFALGAEARAGIIARAQHKAERRERGGIEAHAGVEICDASSDVVVHDCSPVKT